MNFNNFRENSNRVIFEIRIFRKKKRISKFSKKIGFRKFREKIESRNFREKKKDFETFEKNGLFPKKLTIFDQKLSISFQIQSLWLNQKFL